MDSEAVTRKLAELRARTDRQLIALIEMELKRGLILAQVAASKESALYAMAEQCHALVERLLPQLDGASDAQLAAPGSKLRQLRLALDRVPDERALQWSAAS